MKTERQAKILELIAANRIETQEELLRLLHEAGYPVTQATVSRDIRELSLVKRAEAGTRQFYAAPSQETQEGASSYDTVFREGFLSAETAQNILVIRTRVGMAMAVAASLDALHEEGIVGTIAGDDTIMCAVKTAEEAERIREKLCRYAKGNISYA